MRGRKKKREKKKDIFTRQPALLRGRAKGRGGGEVELSKMFGLPIPRVTLYTREEGEITKKNRYHLDHSSPKKKSQYSL